jgi:hypothetical protein
MMNQFFSSLQRLANRRSHRSSDCSPGVQSPVSEHEMPAKLRRNAEILGEAFGQTLTFSQARPLNAEQQPIPWFTYPAIEYLNRIDVSEWNVFEFGIGESTAYWSSRGANVYGVEHNRDWFDSMQARGLPNTHLLYETERARYCQAIRSSSDLLDVIVVDGIYRETCIEFAIASLKSYGIIILDNSDWYHVAGQILRDRGFLEVSFSGFGPINDYTWTTSFFFRELHGRHLRLKPPTPIGGIKLDPSQTGGDLW